MEQTALRTPPTPPTNPESHHGSPLLTMSIDKNMETSIELEDLTDNMSITSGGAGSGGSSESDHISTDLLKLDVKGCVGLIERLPVTLKAVLVSACSILGLVIIAIMAIALRAEQVKLSADAQYYVELCRVAVEVAHFFQKERVDGGLMLMESLNYQRQIDFMKAASQTDVAFTKLSTIFKSKFGSEKIIQSMENSINAKYATIPEVRARATTKVGITTSDFANAYGTLITDIINLPHALSGLFGYNIQTASFEYASELLEVSAKIVFVGNSFLLNDTSLANYRALSSVHGQRTHLTRMVQLIASDVEMDIFQRLILNSTSKSKVDSMMAELMEGKTRFSFTQKEWFDAAQEVLDNRYQLVLEFGQQLIQYVTQYNLQNWMWIVVLAILTVFFGTTSVISTVFFSRAVIAPWQRLNEVQETTISKFVPKKFLSLMEWKRISDAALGKCIEREMTIVVIHVAHFDKLICSTNSSDLFGIVNSLLAYLGPYIRNNSGYIDKILDGEIICIFQKDKRAMKAAIEIQSALNNFNKVQAEQNKPKIQLYVSFVCGKGYAGTIGENEHMESAVLSNNLIFAQKLQRICKRAHVPIITTRETIARLPKKRVLYYRFLGNVSFGSLGSTEVFEILTSDSQKIKTRDLFSRGVQYLHKDSFNEALQTFESISKSNPKDMLAAKYAQVTRNVINQNLTKCKTLTMQEILMDSVLQMAFEEFCNHEHSSENMSLWKEIQTYKQVEPAARRNVAVHIFQQYMDAKGSSPANLTAEVVAPVRRVIEVPELGCAHTLLSEVEAACEMNLLDTMQRFKESASYRSAFCSSCYIIHKEEISWKHDFLLE